MAADGRRARATRASVSAPVVNLRDGIADDAALRDHRPALTPDARSAYGDASMSERDDPMPPDPLVNDEGVDLTLIRWSLALTPLERLRVLEDHMNFAAKVREARRDATR